MSARLGSARVSSLGLKSNSNAEIQTNKKWTASVFDGGICRSAFFAFAFCLFGFGTFFFLQLLFKLYWVKHSGFTTRLRSYTVTDKLNRCTWCHVLYYWLQRVVGETRPGFRVKAFGNRHEYDDVNVIDVHQNRKGICPISFVCFFPFT